MVKVLSWPANLQGTWWLFPVMLVLSCTAMGLGLERAEIVKGFYASPYVMIVAWSALRCGRRGGLLAAILASLVWNWLFVKPLGFHWPANEELMAYLSMFGASWVVGGYTPKNDAPKQSRYSGALPFVRTRKRDDDPCQFWDVDMTGVWSFDAKVGQEYARIYIERCKWYGAPALSWIVRDMIRSGTYSGVEAGFIGGVASQLPARQRISMPLSTHDDTDDLHLD